MHGRVLNTSRVRARAGRRGATLVEFALGFLLFIMLLIGVVEGARVVWAYATLAHAAREGVRYAMVNGHQGAITDSDVQGYIAQRAPGLRAEDISVTTTWEDASRSGSSVVEVEATYAIATVAAPLVFGQPSIVLRHTAHATVAE